jgi:hypothetical protein
MHEQEGLSFIIVANQFFIFQESSLTSLRLLRSAIAYAILFPIHNPVFQA